MVQEESSNYNPKIVTLAHFRDVEGLCFLCSLINYKYSVAQCRLAALYLQCIWMYQEQFEYYSVELNIKAVLNQFVIHIYITCHNFINLFLQMKVIFANLFL